MSAPEATASNVVPPTLDQEPPFYKFPPFPNPPPGVTIMPFKDFKSRGIQLFSEPKGSNMGSGPGEEEDDAELDALGIPTVELRIKHATDECKSSSRKRRKKKKAAAAEAEVSAPTAVPVKKRLWYEEWEEGEDLRVTMVRYDPTVPPVDRFLQSANDFRTGRPWPPVTSGLNNLWDQFRLFTGLLVNPSVFRKADTKKHAPVESPDFASDDEGDEDEPATGDWANPTVEEVRPAKRPRPGESLDIDESSFFDAHKSDDDVREDGISNFLSDPEKAVRIFLSSYMREHGLIWTERNLTYIPRLIFFFLAFVVRNRVLPEPTYQRGLKRALETIEWAKKELPLTYKVGQSFPDAFNEACRECFGRQGGINWSFVNGTTTTTATEQRDTHITVTDISNDVKTSVAFPTETQMRLKDAIEDNVDMEVALDTSSAIVPPTNEDGTDENIGSWGSGRDNAWGDSNEWGGGPWDDNAWAQSPVETREGQEMNGETVGNSTDWAGADSSWNRELSSLFSLLGPSAFPLTHTTGVVECSTRRIVAIHFPAGHPKSVPSPSHINLSGVVGAEAGAACGVEAELDARFAKVILEPWGREEGDISLPEIWSTSRGPVVDPNKPLSKKASAMDAGDSATREPHNPLTDNITLLVVPAFAEMLTLVPGLGLGAMWIEIARQKRDPAGIGAGGAGQVDETVPGRFWYHEDVTGIFPSFYTPRAKE